MFLLQIIGIVVVLIFTFASGLDPIDSCSDEYKEDFSCFFQNQYNIETQPEQKFCTLNNFTCLVNQPINFGQTCLKNQSILQNDWQCYTEDLKPMSYKLLPNKTDFMGKTFSLVVTYDSSNPPPFSQLSSNSETYNPNISENSIFILETYSFSIKNSGTYKLKIFQPAYQDCDEVIFNITQGHYYIHSKSNLNSNNEVETLFFSFCSSSISFLMDHILYLADFFLQTINHD